MSVTWLAIVRQECRTSYKILLNAQIHAVRSITTDKYSFVAKRIASRH